MRTSHALTGSLRCQTKSGCGNEAEIYLANEIAIRKGVRGAIILNEYRPRFEINAGNFETKWDVD